MVPKLIPKLFPKWSPNGGTEPGKGSLKVIVSDTVGVLSNLHRLLFRGLLFSSVGSGGTLVEGDPAAMLESEANQERSPGTCSGPLPSLR